jgi:hypothetical protein
MPVRGILAALVGMIVDSAPRDPFQPPVFSDQRFIDELPEYGERDLLARHGKGLYLYRDSRDLGVVDVERRAHRVVLLVLTVTKSVRCGCASTPYLGARVGGGGLMVCHFVKDPPKCRHDHRLKQDPLPNP